MIDIKWRHQTGSTRPESKQRNIQLTIDNKARKKSSFSFQSNIFKEQWVSTFEQKVIFSSSNYPFEQMASIFLSTSSCPFFFFSDSTFKTSLLLEAQNIKVCFKKRDLHSLLWHTMDVLLNYLFLSLYLYLSLWHTHIHTGYTAHTHTQLTHIAHTHRHKTHTKNS